MVFAITQIFPNFWVDAATLLTLLPLSLIFYSESLTNELSFRWEKPITLLSLNKQDYRSEMFKDTFHVACFIIWTGQMIINIPIVYFHFTKPHHPKFYSTCGNRISICAHIVGGILGIFGFYIGALLNLKEICIVGAAGGFFLHLPAVIWQNRQTHGQREMSQASYFVMSVMLLKVYIDFFLYDANFQAVFSCGMALNVYAMVRFYFFLSVPYLANIESSYDRTLFFAGFSNFAFVYGIFSSLYFMFAFHLWNFYFNLIEPIPKSLMRIERGYWDVIPDHMEKKRGTTFEKELNRQRENEENDGKEAIAKALWTIIVGNGDDKMMEIASIKELYEAWGMPDAESAALKTFKNYDLDNSGFIDYDEFKAGFKVLIEGIYVIGEYEDTARQRQRLVQEDVEACKNKKKQVSAEHQRQLAFYSN